MIIRAKVLMPHWDVYTYERFLRYPMLSFINLRLCKSNTEVLKEFRRSNCYALSLEESDVKFLS